MLDKPATDTKTADLYRMVMPDHVCPYGLKSKDRLEREGFTVNDHWLTTREETDAFKQKHDVKTTPQTFIDGQRVGGWDGLRKHFGMHVPDEDETTYTPVIAIFATCALMALALSFAMGTLVSLRTIELFVALSMCGLAIQKLRDVESFSSMFLNYDLLGRRFVPYAYAYPFAEAFAGILMLAGGVLALVASPVALFIGAIGAASVIKAVYIDKRELKCACVGGASNVPLGPVSLTENVMMAVMGVWMPIKILVLGW